MECLDAWVYWVNKVDGMIKGYMYIYTCICMR